MRSRSASRSKEDVLLTVALIVACAVLSGIPIFYEPGSEINQDPYLYLSIANYYFCDPDPHLRDAGTVGPVIPALIAAAKYALSPFITWTSNAEVYLLKGLAFCCYLAIVLSASTYLRKSVTPVVVFTFLSLFMGLRIWVNDNLSLNGELVSVALMMVILAQATKPASLANTALAAVLAVLTVYTKVQSVPLLILLLLSCHWEKQERLPLIVMLALMFVLAELVFYSKGIGLIRSVQLSLFYVRHPELQENIQQNSHGLLAILLDNRYIRNLPWTAYSILCFSPLFFVVLFYIVRATDKPAVPWKDSRLWLLVLILTILTPGRRFYHYVLYAYLFVIIFARPLLRALERSVMTARVASSVPVSLLVFILLAIVASSAVTDIEATGLRLSPEITDARKLVENDTGRVHIHGWDYRLYTPFGVCNDGIDLSGVYLGVIPAQVYIKRVLGAKYKYIVDVVGFSTILDPAYAITPSTIFGATLIQRYIKISGDNGVRVFRLKE